MKQNTCCKALLVLVLSLVMMLGLAVVSAAAVDANGDHVCDSTPCLVCDIAAKINALPDEANITVDNAAAVTEQIHAIDRVKMDLTDDQYDELLTVVATQPNGSGYGLAEPVRYMEAVEKVVSLNAGGSLAVGKSYSVGSAQLDWAQTDATLTIESLDAGSTFAPLSVTLSDIDNLSALIYHGLYSATADGWTNCYILPAGTYKVTETGYNAVTASGEVLTTTASYSVDGNAVSTNYAVVTVEEGKNHVVSVLNETPPIEEVSVTIIAPVVGTTPADTAFEIPEDVSYTASLIWENESATPLDDDDIFEKDKTYTAHVTFTPKEYFVFDDSCSVTINGSVVEPDEKTANCIIATQDFTPITILNSAELTVVAPVSGDHPDYTVTLPDDANYTVDDVTWTDENSTLSAASVFTIGKTYKVTVVLAPNTDYAFAAAPSISINDSSATVEDVSEGMKRASYTFIAIPRSYNLWVGGVEVTEQNADDVLGDDTVSYDPATKTLTLNGATLTATDAAAIKANGDLNIALKGNNKVSVENLTQLCAINSDGNLTITGNGSLEVKITANTVQPTGPAALGSGFYGIHSTSGTVTIGNGTDSPTISSSAKNIHENPMAASGIGGGVVVIKSGTITATGTGSGITGERITIEGGTVTATSTGHGIAGSMLLTIEGGTVTATGTMNGISFGEVAIEGGTVTATGARRGITGNNIAITGGTVKANGVDYGIYGHMGVSVSNGTKVSAKADDNSGTGIGASTDPTPSGTITISGAGTEVKVGCRTGLSATTVRILDKSIVTINAVEDAIIGTAALDLGTGTRWYEWTDSATATTMNNSDFVWADHSANPPAYLRFAPTGAGVDPDAGENSGQGTTIPQPPAYYPIYIPTAPQQSTELVTSPETFDSGIATSVVLTLLAATGTAWLGKKKD